MNKTMLSSLGKEVRGEEDQESGGGGVQIGE